MDEELELVGGDLPSGEAVADDEQEEADQEELTREFLAKALKEFEADQDHDKENREEAFGDLAFLHDPKTQWLEADRKTREEAGRPCPVLARLQPFVKQVTNDLRMNKPAIEVKPVETDDRSDADRIESVIRYVERLSQAKNIYASWAEDQVECGIGNVRGAIRPARTNPKVNDIVLEYIEDPLSVIWDRSAVKRDRSDARRVWVLDYLPQEEIDEAYGEALGEWPDGDTWKEWSDWRGDDLDEVRIVEYYAMKDVSYTTYRVLDDLGSEQQVELPASEPAPENAFKVSTTKRRECRMWLLTAGKILEGGLEGIFVPGSRVPIFPSIAHEKRLGRRMIRKGMVRDAKDSVRLINWATALIIEAMATAPRAKYVGPASAFEGREADWDTAATDPKSWIAYNDNAKTAPTYEQPPIFNPGLLNALQLFDENIKQVTGIYDASLGARSNETSGRAITAREAQGDTATFDYIDNHLLAIESLGRWLAEVIPDVYTDERIMRIEGRNGKEQVVTLNQVDPATGERINPIQRAVYDVNIKAGPAFATQREKAAESMRTAMQSAPQLAPILLDLLIGLEDWPNAERVEKRLQLMLPPQIQQLEGIQGAQPSEPPPPDPKAIAGAEKDMASKQKIEAETKAQMLDNLLKAMETGMPPAAALQFVFAPAGTGPAGSGAPPNGHMPPVAPPTPEFSAL